MKIKKIFCLAILLSSSFFQLHGEEIPITLEKEKVDIHDRYGYFTYGFGLPGIFGLNLGMRNQHNHHGFEYGVGVVPLIFVYEIHAFTSYLYYPSPSLESQFYFGLGLRGGYANLTNNKWEKGEGYAAPGMIFGKSYHTKEESSRFFQVAFSPAAFAKKKVRFAPSINVSYGYCF